MREDEYRKLAAQRQDAIEELRSFNDAMRTVHAEAFLYPGGPLEQAREDAKRRD